VLAVSIGLTRSVRWGHGRAHFEIGRRSHADKQGETQSFNRQCNSLKHIWIRRIIALGGIPAKLNCSTDGIDYSGMRRITMQNCFNCNVTRCDCAWAMSSPDDAVKEGCMSWVPKANHGNECVRCGADTGNDSDFCVTCEPNCTECDKWSTPSCRQELDGTYPCGWSPHPA
jgi:hypothetical protein